MKTMSLADFHALGAADPTIIDVREPGEYVQGHVPGAVLIPLSQLADRRTEVPHAGPVYVICRSGNRSKVGAEVLAYGGCQAISVDEGTLGWIARGWPVVTGPDPR